MTRERATACVILAAGRATRYGRNKLLEPIGATTLLHRAIAACAGFETIAICSPQTAAAIHDSTHVRVLINEHPERGMSKSLQIANDAVDPAFAVAVMPADLALVEPAHVRAIIESAGDNDVTYPIAPDETPGHPVVFSARARERIGALSDGDTIRALRDDPDLKRQTIVVPQAWPFTDVDVPGDVADQRN